MPSCEENAAVRDERISVLVEKLRLPTFEAAGLRLYHRLTFIAHELHIVKVFYPVFPPQQNAADVLSWLSQSPPHTRQEPHSAPHRHPAHEPRRSRPPAEW